MNERPEDPNAPDMLTREQASDVLGIRLRALHYWRTGGRLLPGTVVTFQRPYGGHPLVRFRKSKLEELLAQEWNVTEDTPRNVQRPDIDEQGVSDTETGE